MTDNMSEGFSVLSKLALCTSIFEKLDTWTHPVASFKHSGTYYGRFMSHRPLWSEIVALALQCELMTAAGAV